MTAYGTEARYPLELAPAMPDVWELWQRAKTLEWDPQTDIPWEQLQPERYTEEQILAARLHWSRRTWGGVVGIRVLLKGSCGFAATPHLTRAHLTRAVTQAIGLAKDWLARIRTALIGIREEHRADAATLPNVSDAARTFSLDPARVRALLAPKSAAR